MGGLVVAGLEHSGHPSSRDLSRPSLPALSTAAVRAGLNLEAPFHLHLWETYMSRLKPPPAEQCPTIADRRGPHRLLRAPAAPPQPWWSPASRLEELTATPTADIMDKSLTVKDLNAKTVTATARARGGTTRHAWSAGPRRDLAGAWPGLPGRPDLRDHRTCRGRSPGASRAQLRRARGDARRCDRGGGTVARRRHQDLMSEGRRRQPRTCQPVLLATPVPARSGSSSWPTRWSLPAMHVEQEHRDDPSSRPCWSGPYVDSVCLDQRSYVAETVHHLNGGDAGLRAPVRGTTTCDDRRPASTDASGTLRQRRAAAAEPHWTG